MEHCTRCKCEFPDVTLTEEQKAEGMEILCEDCYSKEINDHSHLINDHCDPKVMH